MSQLESVLRAAFAPEYLEVRDESDGHSVPRGSESHARVVVVSHRFAGLRLIGRHRLVNEAAAPLFAAGLHALAVEAFEPSEWEARGGVVAKSPACLGGGAHERQAAGTGRMEERS